MQEIITTENTNELLSSTLKEIKNEVAELKRVLFEEGIASQKIYTNKGIKEKLGIGDKTLQRYRDEGKLRFHQDKDKFWYTQADIDEFLARNEIAPYAYEN